MKTTWRIDFRPVRFIVFAWALVIGVMQGGRLDAQDAAILAPILEKNVVQVTGVLSKSAQQLAQVRQFVADTQDILALKDGLDSIPLVYELKALYGEGFALFEEWEALQEETQDFSKFLKQLDEIELDTSDPRMLKLKVGAEQYTEKLTRRLNDREKAMLQDEAWSQAFDARIKSLSEKGALQEIGQLMKMHLDLQKKVNQRAENEREQEWIDKTTQDIKATRQRIEEEKYQLEAREHLRGIAGSVFGGTRFEAVNPYDFEQTPMEPGRVVPRSPEEAPKGGVQ